eukprot:4749240-Amphidinium_carterae.1
MCIRDSHRGREHLASMHVVGAIVLEGGSERATTKHAVLKERENTKPATPDWQLVVGKLRR